MPRERLNGLGASGMRQTEALPQPRVPTGAGGKVEGNEFQLCDLEVPPPPSSGKSHSHGKEGFSRWPETKLSALKMP